MVGILSTFIFFLFGPLVLFVLISILPGWLYWTILLGCITLCSYLLVHVMQPDYIRENKILFFVIVILGMGLAFVIVSLSVLIPENNSKKKQEEIKNSSQNFNSNIASLLEFGTPEYLAVLSEGNTSRYIDEYNFLIKVPVSIKEPFRDSDITGRSLYINFISNEALVEGYPQIAKCEEGRLGLRIEPKLQKSNTAGRYTLVFGLVYYYVNLRPENNCKLEDILSLEGNRFNIISGYDDTILREYTVRDIQIVN